MDSTTDIEDSPIKKRPKLQNPRKTAAKAKADPASLHDAELMLFQKPPGNHMRVPKKPEKKGITDKKAKAEAARLHAKELFAVCQHPQADKHDSSDENDSSDEQSTKELQEKLLKQQREIEKLQSQLVKKCKLYT